MKTNYSIMDNAIPVSDKLYVLAIAHDANAEDQDYYNAAIILEKISKEQHIVQLFESKAVDEDQVTKLTVAETAQLSTDAFKERIKGKDYYAIAFSVSNNQAENVTEKLHQGLEKSKEFFSRKRPAFFSSEMLGHSDETTTFAWARELMLNAITSDSRDAYIPESIRTFKEESKHIGDLSPSKRCLVM